MHSKTIHHDSRTSIIQISDFCPHCGKIMEPEQIHVAYDPMTQTYLLVVRCTVDNCRKFFSLEYSSKRENSPYKYLHLDQLLPYTYDGFSDDSISQNIKELSPEFSQTYSQALIAESKNLDNILGISLRKAFEFLVKDFALYQNPQDSENIKKQSLNNVIDQYYQVMPTLHSMAHIIRKIGNDETHYYRKYNDVDVNDLKMLIANFSLYINMVLDVENYTKKTS